MALARHVILSVAVFAGILISLHTEAVGDRRSQETRGGPVLYSDVHIPQPQAGTGVIQGVVRTTSGAIVSSARVNAYVRSGNTFTWLAYGVSDATGLYRITGLATGEYRVQIDNLLSLNCPSCIDGQWYNIKRTASESDPVQVTEPSTTQLDIALQRGGVLHGYVRDESMSPIANATVSVYDASGAAIQQLSADSAGNYSTQGLWPCAYRLAAAKSTPWYLVKTYSGGAASVNDATAIAVSDYPVVTSAPDLVMTTGGAIAGAVTNPGGAALTSVLLEAVKTDDGTSIATVFTGSGGTFAHEHLAVGSYRLRAKKSQNSALLDAYIPTWYSGAGDFDTAAAVDVAPSSYLNGQNIALPVGGRIGGSLFDRTGAPPFAGYVQSYDADGVIADQSFLPFGTSNYITHYGLAAGQYRLKSMLYAYAEQPTPGVVDHFTAITAWLGGRRNCSEAEAVLVSPPLTQTGMNFSVPPNGMLVGQVKEQATGNPVTRGKVRALTPDPMPGAKYASVYAESAIDASGQYRLEALPQGEYFLCYEIEAGETQLIPVCDDGRLGTLDIGTFRKTMLLAGEVITRNLTIPRGRRIAGRVDSGCGQARGYVRVVDVSTGSPVGYFATIVLDDGSFSTPPLPVGGYRLFLGVASTAPGVAAGSEWYHGKGRYTLGDVIAVGSDSDTVGVTFRPGNAGRLAGRVTGNAGKGIVGAGVQIYDLDGSVLASVQTREGGYWDNLQNPLRAGELYKVQVLPPECSGLAPLWYNGKPDLGAADAILVEAGSTSSGINMVLSPLDTDGDGIPDLSDSDDDNDGYPDVVDCCATDPTVHPGAPEINDGKDNQCPGDVGYGTSDEIAASLAFTSTGSAANVCWQGQLGATTYQITYSSVPTFSSACCVEVTSGTCWQDSLTPSVSSPLFYLARTLTPFAGSWGTDSAGLPRDVICSSASCQAQGP